MEWRGRNDEVRLVDSTRLDRAKEGERRAATLAAKGIDAVNMHHLDWTGGLTTLFHRFGVLCFAWDAQARRCWPSCSTPASTGSTATTSTAWWMHCGPPTRTRTAEPGRATPSQLQVGEREHLHSAAHDRVLVDGAEARLSALLVRLSPMTKTWSSGTVTASDMSVRVPGSR